MDSKIKTDGDIHLHARYLEAIDKWAKTEDRIRKLEKQLADERIMSRIYKAEVNRLDSLIYVPKGISWLEGEE